MDDSYEVSKQSVVVDSAAAATSEKYFFEFKGGVKEYYRIWLVNLLFTVVTLGIYAPWAKVRTRRYLYGNTLLRDINFNYHASPLSILIARAILVAVFIAGAYWAGEDLLRQNSYFILILLVVPFLVVRGFAFNAHNSSYCGIRFSFNKSRNTYYRLYSIALPIFILLSTSSVLDTFLLEAGIAHTSLLTIFLAPKSFTNFQIITAGLSILIPLLLLSYLPLFHRAYHHFTATNHRWGDVAFTFSLPSIKSYLVAYWVMISIFLGVILLGVFLGLLTFGLEWLVIGFYFFAIVVLLILNNIRKAILFCCFWNSVRLPGGHFKCRFTAAQFAFRILSLNQLAIVFSLGLAYPWTQIRKIRFLTSHIDAFLLSPDALDAVFAQQLSREGALGEEFEIDSNFEFDVGLI